MDVSLLASGGRSADLLSTTKGFYVVLMLVAVTCTNTAALGVEHSPVSHAAITTPVG